MKQNKSFDLVLRVIEDELENNRRIIKQNDLGINYLQALSNNIILLRLKKIILEEYN